MGLGLGMKTGDQRTATGKTVDGAGREKKLNAARKTPGDHVGPHGSFPITDEKSVNSAMRLAGHAADPAAIRAKVKAKAKAKGLTAGIPKADR